MKKLLQKINDFKALGAFLVVLLLFSNVGWGQQQLIGSFPIMDGGFENQTVAGLTNGGSFATGTSASVWTTASTITGAALELDIFIPDLNHRDLQNKTKTKWFTDISE